jgi:hypothetical protein
LSFAKKFGLALMIIAAGGVLVDSQKDGGLSKALASSPHVPLFALGAAAYFVNK